MPIKIPKLRGVDREVLGFQATSKSDVVASYDGDRVVFKAGTLANFVVGSTVAVFPGMPKTPDWNSAPVVVKIGGHNINQSWGMVKKGDENDLKLLQGAGGVARVVEVGPTGFRVKVNLKAAPDSLKTALRKIPHLVEVKSGTLGSYRFVQTAGGLKLVDHDGRSQLIPNYNGEKPLDFARTPGQEKHLIWAIERLTRLERIRYLEQHGEGTAKISISLLTGENFETVHNVDEQMRVKMRVGSAFKIRIKNDGETPMVAHIASFDSDGMVTILSERMKDKSHCPRKKNISQRASLLYFRVAWVRHISGALSLAKTNSLWFLHLNI